MSVTNPSARHPARRSDGITPSVAGPVWLATWFAGNLVGAVLIGATGEADADPMPIWVMAIGVTALWTAMLAGAWWVCRRFGSGSPQRDFGIAFHRDDVLGVPIGVAAQLVLLPLIYVPLQQLWPDTFGRDDVERTARDLTDTARGGWIAVLVFIVVIGAPVVEEVVYRGMLQGAALRRWSVPVAVGAIALLFAGIHLRAIELPGLFAFALVLGVCAVRSGRLGLPIVTHMAFNATGLLLVALR